MEVWLLLAILLTILDIDKSLRRIAAALEKREAA